MIDGDAPSVMDRSPPLEPTEPHGEEDRPMPRGSTIGRFLVLATLGAGGMGVVLSAYDPDLDRKVALKLLHGDRRFGKASRGRAQLVAEAQAMARLAHPNVVAVYEIGFTENGAFVVMEHVDGRTLRAWLQGAERPWAEILAMFLEAGEGLAAAHRAGIVHRDFKPENVLVGEDGRARVVDFGLAAAASGGARERSLRGGAILGTVAYMAPEQLRGEPCDARADQFAYCLALWEALHGERPFAGETAEELLPNIVAGVVRAPARATPEWLRAALVRGLSAAPEARWPALDDLLGVLRRDRWTRRRSLAVAGAGLGVALAAVAAFSFGRRHAISSGCDAGEALAAEVWNDGARERVRAAFAATGRPYAADTFARVDAALGSGLAEWARAHRDTCAATHLRHEQSDSLLDLRMQCLERSRRDAATLVSLLGEADGAALDRAVVAAAAAGDPAPCADTEALTAVVPPPRDADAAREAAAVRLEADRVVELNKLGRVKDSVAAARVLVPRARALGYAPALAAALHAANIAETNGGDPDAAEALAYETVRAAEEAHEDAIRAGALSRLVLTVGYKRHRFAEGEVLARLAEAAVARAGNRPGLLGALYHSEGSMLRAKGDNAAALARFLAELGLVTLDSGWPSERAAAALHDLAEIQEALGQYAAARATLERAARVAAAVLGEDHPSVARHLIDAAMDAVQVSDFEAAAEGYARGLAICERAFGPDSVDAAVALHGLAGTRMSQGRVDEARPLAERAGTIFARDGEDSPNFMASLALQAQIAKRQGRLDDALALAERGHALRTKVDGPEHERTILAEGTIADIQDQRGHLPEARAAFEHELALMKKVLGADHPVTGGTMVQLASVLNQLGRPRDAIGLCEQGIGPVEKGFGPESIQAVQVLAIYTDALLAAGDVSRARALAERADRTAAARHFGPALESQVRFRHAKTLLADDRARACVLGREARAMAATLPNPDDIAEMDRWLARSRCR